ncbi:MAG: site-2 protease family protein [Acidobacteria bacterium]|nr:site-2 protease family protein [Acidobacteriota bacterium]
MSPDPSDRAVVPAPAGRSAPFGPLPAESGGGLPAPYRPRPRRRWVPFALFAATVLTTTYFGYIMYAAFVDGAAGASAPASWLHGAWYSVTILAILGTHEMGHYCACRYYGIDASVPYFLPAPAITGTFGAFIRIRQRIPTKPMLFDIGAAGPIAGFVVAVPALFAGVSLSQVTPAQPALAEATVLYLGEPLLFQAATWIVWGDVLPGHTLNLHPMGFAAWFGLLATALNLFPIGQLDGGHISYAALGARSTAVTIGGIALLALLSIFSLAWIPWTVLLLVTLLVFGPRHPRTLDDAVPLDRRRRLAALGTAAIFAVCFTPTPIVIGTGGPPA